MIVAEGREQVDSTETEELFVVVEPDRIESSGNRSAIRVQVTLEIWRDGSQRCTPPQAALARERTAKEAVSAQLQ